MTDTLQAQSSPTFFQSIRNRLATQLVLIRRRFPHLVWYGDEIDVSVTIKANPNLAADVESALDDIGLSFDRGGNLDERDWEWDWSLRGPISVSFRGVTIDPSKRDAWPRPEHMVNSQRIH